MFKVWRLPGTKKPCQGHFFSDCGAGGGRGLRWAWNPASSARNRRTPARSAQQVIQAAKERFWECNKNIEIQWNTKKYSSWYTKIWKYEIQYFLEIIDQLKDMICMEKSMRKQNIKANCQNLTRCGKSWTRFCRVFENVINVGRCYPKCVNILGRGFSLYWYVFRMMQKYANLADLKNAAK